MGAHGWLGSKVMSGRSHSPFVGKLERYSSYAVHVATVRRACSKTTTTEALKSMLACGKSNESGWRDRGLPWRILTFF